MKGLGGPPQASRGSEQSITSHKSSGRDSSSDHLIYELGSPRLAALQCCLKYDITATSSHEKIKAQQRRLENFQVIP